MSAKQSQREVTAAEAHKVAVQLNQTNALNRDLEQVARWTGEPYELRHEGTVWSVHHWNEDKGWCEVACTRTYEVMHGFVYGMQCGVMAGWRARERASAQPK